LLLGTCRQLTGASRVPVTRRLLSLPQIHANNVRAFGMAGEASVATWASPGGFSMK
jgi:hypothetical protein